MAGLAVAVAMLAGPVANADPVCFQPPRGIEGGFCADGGQSGPGTFVVFGGSAGGVGVNGGSYWSPPGGCSSHACGNRPTYNSTGLGWTGPGGTSGNASTSGQHLPHCTICYQEYHVAGTSTGEVNGRICYSATRTPPLYFC